MVLAGILLVSTIALAIISIVLFKMFLPMINCIEKHDCVILTGQMKLGASSALLPNSVGRHRYKIILNSGRVRLNHNSYNPDGGNWSLTPLGDEKAHINLYNPGTYIYEYNIGRCYEKLDQLQIVNVSLWKQAEFSYQYDIE